MLSLCSDWNLSRWISGLPFPSKPNQKVANKGHTQLRTGATSACCCPLCKKFKTFFGFHGNPRRKSQVLLAPAPPAFLFFLPPCKKKRPQNRHSPSAQLRTLPKLRGSPGLHFVALELRAQHLAPRGCSRSREAEDSGVGSEGELASFFFGGRPLSLPLFFPIPWKLPTPLQKTGLH